MAITENSLTSGTQADATSGQATASISPTGDRLVVCVIGAGDASIETTFPIAISGGGITTWRRLYDRELNSGPSLNVGGAVFVAMESSPGSGTISITWGGGIALDALAWSVFEMIGVNTDAADGAGAIRRMAETQTSSTGDISGPMPAFGAAANGCLSFTFQNANERHTQQTGYTEIHDVGVAGGGGGEEIGLSTAWRDDNSATFGADWPALSGDGFAFGIELVEAAEESDLLSPADHLTHHYLELNTKTTSGVGAQDEWELVGLIPGGYLQGNKKYLIVMRLIGSTNSATNEAQFRVKTDDDPDVASKSAALIEFERTATDEGLSYMWPHSFSTSSLPETVSVEHLSSASASEVSSDQVSLWLFDLGQIGESGYWDGTVTDTDGVWTNDANINDGFKTTNANTSTAGTTSTNEIRIAGNTHPTSGDVELPVTVRFYAGSGGAVGTVGFEVFDGGDSLTSGTFPVADSAGSEQSQPFHVPAPSGGWTAAKMEGLEVVIWMVSATTTIEIYRVEFLTGYVEHAPLAYAEMTDTHDGTDGEYSVTAATTLLAKLDGAALGTDEWLILGSVRANIGSTGRWFNHSLHAAYDTSTAAERSLHQAEGEDTFEVRMTGWAIRHQASSGTPDVTLYGTEEAANGNMLDGGAYLIALPTSAFADFEHDYTAAQITINNTETTIATTGSYTPTVTGNHLIFGRSNGETTPTQLGGMWVESTTTEIRTGDAVPTHNQIWDAAKDNEQQVTFQRYSITTAETFNLQSLAAAAFFVQGHRWLIVVNLNPPAAAGGGIVYKPNPYGAMLSR